MHEIPSEFWANRCLVLSKSTILGRMDENNLHPLVAFTMFLAHKQRCILTLTRWDDPTVQQLYLMAREIVEKIKTDEDERWTFCKRSVKWTKSSTRNFYDCLKDEPPKISKALQDTEDRLKRSEETASANEDPKVSDTLKEESPAPSGKGIPSSLRCLRFSNRIRNGPSSMYKPLRPFSTVTCYFDYKICRCK